MIIFGTRGKALSGDALQAVCRSCGNSSHISFGVLRYFHIFWIPVFPTKKEAGLECQHCKYTLLGKDMPNEFKDKIKESIFPFKRTLPYFTGLILFAVLIVSGYASEMTRKDTEKTYVTAPQINDHLVVDLRALMDTETMEYPYGIMRATKVSDEEVELQISNYSYQYSSGALKVLRDQSSRSADFWIEEPYIFTKAYLIELYNDNKVSKVLRP